MKFGDVYGGWARSTEHRGERTYWNGEGGASSATAHRSLLQRNKHQRNPCTPEAKAVALFLSYIFLSARSDVRNAPVQSSAVQWQLLILHVQPGVLCWCSLCMAVHGCATMQRRNNATTYNGSRQRRGKPCQCLQLRQSSCSSRKPYASIASALNSLGSDRIGGGARTHTGGTALRVAQRQSRSDMHLRAAEARGGSKDLALSSCAVPCDTFHFTLDIT